MKGFGFIAAATLCAPVFLAQAQTGGLDSAPTVAGPGAPMSPADTGTSVAKVFTFKQTTQGACVLQNGTLSFDSAGNGTIKLATMTTEDNDNIWKSRVRLRNVAGTSVFTSPELNSPKMENKDGHPQTYHWSYSFHIDPSLIPSATQAEMVEITC